MDCKSFKPTPDETNSSKTLSIASAPLPLLSVPPHPFPLSAALNRLASEYRCYADDNCHCSGGDNDLRCGVDDSGLVLLAKVALENAGFRLQDNGHKPLTIHSSTTQGANSFQKASNSNMFPARKRKRLSLASLPGVHTPVRAEKYECGTCSRSFSSFQALGGHRTSCLNKLRMMHKRQGLSRSNVRHGRAESQVSFSSTAEGDFGVGGGRLPASSGRLHKCPICGRTFTCGQALGGHKRSHNPSALVSLSGISSAAQTVDTSTTLINPGMGSSQSSASAVGSEHGDVDGMEVTAKHEEKCAPSPPMERNFLIPDLNVTPPRDEENDMGWL